MMERWAFLEQWDSPEWYVPDIEGTFHTFVPDFDSLHSAADSILAGVERVQVRGVLIGEHATAEAEAVLYLHYRFGYPQWDLDHFELA